jgi:hypothetical protein
MSISEKKVIPLDMTQLSKDIDKQVKVWAKDKDFKIGKNEKFLVRNKVAFVVGLKEGTGIATGMEAVHEILTPIDGELQYELELHSETEEVNDEGVNVTSFSMSPRFSDVRPIADLIEKYGKNEVTVPEFMGSRFNYNPRIRSNTIILTESITENL